MKIILAVLALVFSLSSTTEAQKNRPEWRMIVERPEYVLHLDTNNIERKQQFVLFVERLTPKVAGFISFNGFSAKEGFRKLVFDCSDSTYVQEQLFLTDSAGSLMHEQTVTVTRYTRWRPVKGEAEVQLYLPIICPDRRRITEFPMKENDR